MKKIIVWDSLECQALAVLLLALGDVKTESGFVLKRVLCCEIFNVVWVRFNPVGHFSSWLHPFFLSLSGLAPDCPAYYGNRAACHMMLSQFSQALDDAKTSVTIDDAFVKGYIRVAKCCISLGDTTSAGQAVDKALSIEPNNATALQEKNNLISLEKFKEDASNSYNARDFRKVRFNSITFYDFRRKSHRTNLIGDCC